MMLPKIVNPREKVVKKLITRPRNASGTKLCNKMLIPAKLLIMPKPMPPIASREIQNTELSEKAMSEHPKSATARAMVRPRPLMVFLPAWRKAAANAPIPLAAIKRPNPSGPRWRMSRAKTGKSVL